MEGDIAPKYRLISGCLLLRELYPRSWHKSVTTRKKMMHDHEVSDRMIKTLEENLVRLGSQEAGRIAELEINLINLPLQEKELSIQAARDFYDNHPEHCRIFKGLKDAALIAICIMFYFKSHIFVLRSYKLFPRYVAFSHPQSVRNIFIASQAPPRQTPPAAARLWLRAAPISLPCKPPSRRW